MTKKFHKIAPQTSPAALSDAGDIREALDINSIGFLTAITAMNQKIVIDVSETDYLMLLIIEGAIRLPCSPANKAHAQQKLIAHKRSSIVLKRPSDDSQPTFAQSSDVAFAVLGKVNDSTRNCCALRYRPSQFR